jgi:hypothetical protein
VHLTSLTFQNLKNLQDEAGNWHFTIKWSTTQFFNNNTKFFFFDDPSAPESTLARRHGFWSGASNRQHSWLLVDV